MPGREGEECFPQALRFRLAPADGTLSDTRTEPIAADARPGKDGKSVTAREVLDKGAARINIGLASQPAIQATLKDTLGTVYMDLGLYNQARPLLDGALTTREHLAGTEPIVLTDSFSHRGWLLLSQGDYKGAERDYRQVLRLLATQPDNQRTREAHAKAQYGLGVVLGYEGRYSEARASLGAALAQQRKMYGDINEDTAATLKEFAVAVDQDGELKMPSR